MAFFTGRFRHKKESSRKHPGAPEDGRAPVDLFCVFVLGGDGTFLAAVRWIGDLPVPIMGVKFGEVGFMAEITEDGLFPAAMAILAGDFTITPRMRLSVRVIRPDSIEIRETVLNDVVLNKGALARLADIETYINGQYLTTFRADGLVVATPTGSTAYSLAAGGPVVHPEVPAIIMTPICPFTLTNRPIIIPDSHRIEISMGKESEETVLVTFDGQVGFDLQYGDTVRICKSTEKIRLLRPPDYSYFRLLRTKLMWGGGTYQDLGGEHHGTANP